MSNSEQEHRERVRIAVGQLPTAAGNSSDGNPPTAIPLRSEWLSLAAFNESLLDKEFRLAADRLGWTMTSQSLLIAAFCVLFGHRNNIYTAIINAPVSSAVSTNAPLAHMAVTNVATATNVAAVTNVATATANSVASMPHFFQLTAQSLDHLLLAIPCLALWILVGGMTGWGAAQRVIHSLEAERSFYQILLSTIFPVKLPDLGNLRGGTRVGITRLLGIAPALAVALGLFAFWAIALWVVCHLPKP